MNVEEYIAEQMPPASVEQLREIIPQKKSEMISIPRADYENLLRRISDLENEKSLR